MPSLAGDSVLKHHRDHVLPQTAVLPEMACFTTNGCFYQMPEMTQTVVFCSTPLALISVFLTFYQCYRPSGTRQRAVVWYRVVVHAVVGTRGMGGGGVGRYMVPHRGTGPGVPHYSNSPLYHCPATVGPTVPRFGP